MINKRLYINDKLIELASESSQVSKTLQVNNLASLDNRQTNFTQNIKIPKTPNNILALDFLSIVGNDSNVPYKKNVINYFIGNDAVIYNGWGVFSQTDEFFNLSVYDGNIDFYKAIENKNLTNIGISELNHVKNIDTVVNSFTSTTLNYKYIITDYNGKNEYTNTATSVTTNINIDYQVPSAKVSYLWNRIFDFAGFTYSGEIFSNIDFTNLWLTYPKPVPTSEPIVTPITTQNSIINVGYDSLFQSYVNSIVLTPTVINTPEISGITINIAGTYRLKCNGSFTVNGQVVSYVGWTLYNGDVIISSGEINAAISESAIISANAGDKLYYFVAYKGEKYPVFTIGTPILGSMTTSIDYVIGYNANFAEALIDFPVKDFVNEIMQRFGLTMFKDKYQNHIDFLTLEEILQGDEQIDWSDKFLNKKSENYIVADYAQKNYFKYKYNTQNDTHNDGFISISNQNLKDETTVISSKIYSPEIGIPFLNSTNVFKIWDKELKDDSKINYKELAGRYYFLRSSNYTNSYPLKIGSEVLNNYQTISNLSVANFSRLKFQEIIYDYYSTIESILDKSKVITAEFFLNSQDIENFDFKKLVYIKQLGSFYLVNKIINWINGKSVNVELIEVDYQKKITNQVSVVPNYITITSIVNDGCQVTINYTTDASNTVPINIVGQPNSFGLTPTILAPQYYYNNTIYATGVNNSVTFNLLAGGFWQFNLEIQGFGNQTIYSNTKYFENISTCNYIPPVPALSYITITNVDTISIIDNVRKIRVDFESDVVLPTSLSLNLYNLGFFTLPINFENVTNKYIIADVQNTGTNDYGTAVIQWMISLTKNDITSNVVNIFD